MGESDTGYILHLRPYRETSMLATVIGRNVGRFNLVCRGSRKGKSTNTLRPFVELQLSWSGRSDLKTLRSAEVLGRSLNLQGDGLYVGMYLNELMVRVLHDLEPHEALTDAYWHTLCALADEGVSEARLRLFEFTLLRELGYELILDMDTETGADVIADGRYEFIPDHGVRHVAPLFKGESFDGRHLLAISAGKLEEQVVLQAAKKITRLALAPHLGSRPLASRALFLKQGTVQ